MLFTKLAVLALPFIGSVFGSPIVKKDELSIEKRDSIVTVITNFQNQVNGPVASLKAANNGNILTANDAQVYLKDILNAIQVAQTGVGSASTKRDLGELASELQARQEADLQIVGAVLAEVIQDIVEAVEGIVDDLRALPLVGALIIAIDGGLTTLLLGVQVVLVGALQIVAGLLGGVLGLVQSLGLSLLAGLLLGA